jgi:hypothetical protein
MKRVLLALGLVLGVPLVVGAQITIPNTFVSGTTASSSQVNANFSALGTVALNRAGGTITGNITVDSGITIDGVDIGAVLGGSGTLTLATLSLTTLTCTGCVGATQLASSGVTAATYGTAIAIPVITVDADGRITGATTTSIASLPENALSVDGVLARLASAQTISGQWSFATGARAYAAIPYWAFVETDQRANSTSWLALVEGKVFSLSAYNDALNSGASFLSATRTTGNTISQVALAGTAVRLDGEVTITGRTLIDRSGAVGAPDLAFADDPDTGFFANMTDGICTGAGGTLGFCVYEVDPGLVAFEMGASARVSSDWVPYGTGSHSLGTTSDRWSEAWVTAGAFNSSDRRLKNSISPIKLGLEFITKLKPVEYRWNNPKLKGLYYGFIAQDLRDLDFEAVDTSNPNEYGLRYTDLIAPLVKAVQELHNELHILDAQNKFLAERIKELEKGNGSRRSIE